MFLLIMINSDKNKNMPRNNDNKSEEYASLLEKIKKQVNNTQTVLEENKVTESEETQSIEVKEEILDNYEETVVLNIYL